MEEKEIKNWYNKKYSTTGPSQRRPFEAYPFLLGYLQADSGTLLDIGCGAGSLLLSASERGLKTYGIDISEEAVKIARDVSKSSFVEVGSAMDLKFKDGSFDYLTCLGSLEHFLDMDKGLQEMRRVAKPDSRFCIVVPNSRFIGWVFKRKKGTEQQDILERLHSLRQWKELFLRNGFKILAVYKDRWFMKYHTESFFGCLKRFFARLIWHVVPISLDYQFVFILEK